MNVNDVLRLTAELPLESKLAFLRQPTAYAEPTSGVESIETHMSWVFLTDRYAYKLKKPVVYDVLNFSTLEARRFYCEEEVRLNRRLAPMVYLGTVALAIDQEGHLHLGNDGTVIDWLVKMFRLPADHMLDSAIASRTAREEHAAQIARLLADFYRTCQPVVTDPDAYRQRLKDQLEQNLNVVGAPAYQLPIDRLRRLFNVQLTLLQRLSWPLEERVRSGKIIEGHGDLRPEHVCLGPELAIIDCLEFSRDLRCIDTIDEVAFLALECERLGAGVLGALLLDHYQSDSGDRADAALVDFYKSLRACMRAKCAIWHMNEEKFRHSSLWPRRTMAYLDLAERHAQASIGAMNM